MAGGRASEIRVNRAPVLTLWAAVVAERLGHDPDAAMTLGRAVAGASARVKARAIGLEQDQHAGDREDGTREKAEPAERRPAPARAVHLLGRDVPVVEGKQGLRALDHGHPSASGPARAYVERAFGEHLPAVRQAMERLAATLPPDELNRVGFRPTSASARRCPPAPGVGGRRACPTLPRSRRLWPHSRDGRLPPGRAGRAGLAVICPVSWLR